MPKISYVKTINNPQNFTYKMLLTRKMKVKFHLFSNKPSKNGPEKLNDGRTNKNNAN